MGCVWIKSRSFVTIVWSCENWQVISWPMGRIRPPPASLRVKWEVICREWELTILLVSLVLEINTEKMCHKIFNLKTPFDQPCISQVIKGTCLSINTEVTCIKTWQYFSTFLQRKKKENLCYFFCEQYLHRNKKVPQAYWVVTVPTCQVFDSKECHFTNCFD